MATNKSYEVEEVVDPKAKEQLLNELRGAIDQVMADLQKKHPDADLSNYRKILESVYLEGKPAKDTMGLGNEVIDALYAFGSNAYNTGNFVMSEAIFRHLLFMDSSQPRFGFALAASLHMQKKYRKALEMYFMCLIYDSENPLVFYHGADCCIHLNQIHAADLLLQNTIDLAKDRPAYSHIVERSKMILEQLIKEEKKLENK